MAQYSVPLADSPAHQLQAENDSLRRKLGALQLVLQGVISESAKFESLAFHDGLTGLPNRRLFDARFAELLSAPGPQGQFALLFIDLDDFKSINDTIGHRAGDELLRKVATTLNGLIRGLDQ